MSDSENNVEQRLVELESRLAFQDHILDELNGVITSQQAQLDTLEKELLAVQKQLKAVFSDSGAGR